MASSTLNLKHPQFEVRKTAPVGFSWTVFFFGIFPAIFRGDWKWTLIMLVAAVCTLGLSNLVFCFIYNKLYIQSLLEQGYTSVDPDPVRASAEGKLGIIIPENGN